MTCDLRNILNRKTSTGMWRNSLRETYHFQCACAGLEKKQGTRAHNITDQDIIIVGANVEGRYVLVITAILLEVASNITIHTHLGSDKYHL